VAARSPLRVTIVGVCASGKSVLAERLRGYGLEVRIVAQEHSCVLSLWRHGGLPEVLIYLGASWRAVRRRGRLSLTAAELREQRRRLRQARRHAAVRVTTDHRSRSEVAAAVLRGIARTLLGRYTAEDEHHDRTERRAR
jgi:hypothetical protein